MCVALDWDAYRSTGSSWLIRCRDPNSRRILARTHSVCINQSAIDSFVRLHGLQACAFTTPPLPPSVCCCRDMISETAKGLVALFTGLSFACNLLYMCGLASMQVSFVFGGGRSPAQLITSSNTPKKPLSLPRLKPSSLLPCCCAALQYACDEFSGYVTSQAGQAALRFATPPAAFSKLL